MAETAARSLNVKLAPLAVPVEEAIWRIVESRPLPLLFAPPLAVPSYAAAGEAVPAPDPWVMFVKAKTYPSVPADKLAAVPGVIAATVLD